MNPRIALLAVAVAAALFGTTGTASALGPDSVSPLTAGAWRAFVGGCGLVLLALVRRMDMAIRRPDWGWIALASVAVAINQLAFLEAVDRTGVAVGTLVTIATGPVVAGLVGYLVNGNRPTQNWVLGSALAFAGVALLSGTGSEVDGAGLALAVASGAGAVVVAPVALTGAKEVFAEFDNTLLILYLGLATLALAYTLWGIGLSHLSLNVVVSTTLLEPAVASVLAVAFLDEALSVFLVVGLVMVAAGVWLASRLGAVVLE